MVNICTQISPSFSGLSVPDRVHSPCWLYPNNTEDLQGYSAMQAPLLNRGGHEKAAKEEKISFKKVLNAYFLGWKNSQCWEKAHGEHCSDSQGKCLCAPKNSHQ